ncbi:hypothetical protein KIH72_019785, partial [Acinetobacter baumannii]|uniref:hypothetical protein n=1 Tax=Acinetobacter baumannii TaxID=470 RepID=UPI001D05C98C
YQVIAKKATTRTLYADQLVQEKVLDRAEADQMVEDYRADLEAGNHVANALILEPNTKMCSAQESKHSLHDYPLLNQHDNLQP